MNRISTFAMKSTLLKLAKEDPTFRNQLIMMVKEASITEIDVFFKQEGGFSITMKRLMNALKNDKQNYELAREIHDLIEMLKNNLSLDYGE